MVCDHRNHSIRRVFAHVLDVEGDEARTTVHVETVAGGNFEGLRDDRGAEAKFSCPSHICVDGIMASMVTLADNNSLSRVFYVTDRGNHKLRKIAAAPDHGGKMAYEV